MDIGAYIDPVTRLCDTNPVLRDAVYEHVRHKAEDVFLVEGDFINARGLNNAIGRTATNAFIKFVLDTYNAEITRLNPDYIYINRRKGKADEVSLIVEGVSAGALDQALQSAQRRIAAFAAAAGLDTLRHSRYPDRAGAGIMTAFKAINGEERPFSVVKDELQNRIAESKKTQPSPPPAGIRDSYDYLNNTSREMFYEALRQYGYTEATTRSKPLLPVSLPQKISEYEVDDIYIEDSRQKPIDVKAVLESGAPQSLLRFNLHGLSSLNVRIGPGNADHIITAIQDIVYETLSGEGYEVVYYESGPGTVDVLLPEADEEEINRLKEIIHYKAYGEIFGQTIDDYAAVHGLTIDGELPVSGGEALGLLLHKDGITRGIGLIAAHTIIAGRKMTPENILSRLDALAELQNTYYAAFLERTSDGRMKCYDLYPVGKSIEDCEIIANRDPERTYGFPYAHSLVHRMAPEKIMEIFRQPAGRILQTLFGYDITAVLERQKTIDDLLEAGIARENEVLTNNHSIVAADFWLSSRKEPRQSYNIHDIPGTRVREDTSLMTMFLAARWNVIPEDLYEAVLLGQAGVRSLVELERGCPGVDSGFSASYLAQDIRTHMKDEQKPELQRIQATEQIIKTLHHAANITGEPVPAEVSAALTAIVAQSLHHAARRFSVLSDTSLAAHFEAAGGSCADTADTVENPQDIAQRALDNVRAHIADSTAVGDAQRAKILSNLNSLAVSLALSETEQDPTLWQSLQDLQPATPQP